MFHQGGSGLLMAENPVLQLLHQTHWVRGHGQGLAMPGHGSNSSVETKHSILTINQEKSGFESQTLDFPEKEIQVIYLYQL